MEYVKINIFRTSWPGRDNEVMIADLLYPDKTNNKRFYISSMNSGHIVDDEPSHADETYTIDQDHISRSLQFNADKN